MFKRLHQDSQNSIHPLVTRDWGHFVVLHTVHVEDAMVHKEKLLVIKPETSLTLHKHLGYSELWIGESDFSYILENEHGELIEYTAEAFERVFIPKNRKHTITSKAEHLRIFEIQSGVILEDDNIKF